MTDEKMPFGEMVVLCLRWAVAAIPALILLMFVAALGWILVAGTFSWLDGQLHEPPPATRVLGPR